MGDLVGLSSCCSRKIVNFSCLVLPFGPSEISSVTSSPTREPSEITLVGVLILALKASGLFTSGLRNSRTKLVASISDLSLVCSITSRSIGGIVLQVCSVRPSAVMLFNIALSSGAAWSESTASTAESHTACISSKLHLANSTGSTCLPKSSKTALTWENREFTSADHLRSPVIALTSGVTLRNKWLPPAFKLAGLSNKTWRSERSGYVRSSSSWSLANIWRRSAVWLSTILCNIAIISSVLRSLSGERWYSLYSAVSCSLTSFSWFKGLVGLGIDSVGCWPSTGVALVQFFIQFGCLSSAI